MYKCSYTRPLLDIVYVSSTVSGEYRCSLLDRCQLSRLLLLLPTIPYHVAESSLTSTPSAAVDPEAWQSGLTVARCSRQYGCNTWDILILIRYLLLL